jgi:hypothetical protein
VAHYGQQSATDRHIEITSMAFHSVSNRRESLSSCGDWIALTCGKNGDEEFARQKNREISRLKEVFPEAVEAKKLCADLGGK